ncbi:hypothetical protein [Xanthomonas arboricola]|uniref:hypothetical protein n=1 Tax=Xanthomonas arboricola TaxID=56448 RepID=UPI00137B1FC9|nr:hypothetical protein [Xanthomonas arboricola]
MGLLDKTPAAFLRNACASINSAPSGLTPFSTTQLIDGHEADACDSAPLLRLDTVAL